MINYLATLRAYALWGRDHRMGQFLVVFYIAACVSSAIVLVIYDVNAHVVHSPFLTICELDPNRLIGYMYLGPFALELANVTLTIIKIGKHAAGDAPTQLHAALLRDGMICFIVFILSRIFNMVVYLGLRSPLSVFSFYFGFASSVVTCTRMFLNLREVTTSTDWSIATSLPALVAPAFRKPTGRTELDTFRTDEFDIEFEEQAAA